MNFMGMGLAEIAVVLVVAFLVLGPNRTINLARTAGKIFADLRRTFSEVAAAVSLEEKGQAASPVESHPTESHPVETRPGEPRPVAQPQPPLDEPAPAESWPEEPPGPTPAKNGDE